MKEFCKWLLASLCAWSVYAGLLAFVIAVDLPEAAALGLLFPFFLFALAISVLNPGKRIAQRFVPDGKFKRMLLFKLN